MSKETKQMNVKELRDDLIKTYQQLRNGSIGLNEAKQLSNVAGKIMGTAKTQLEYNKYAQSKEKIEFLTSDK